MSADNKVALVTGASSGIGAATALELSASGFVVYGVARRVDRMGVLAERGGAHTGDGRHRRGLHARRR